MNDYDWGSTDISRWTSFECCAWLLFLLETNRFRSNPYCVPFSKYVLTWHQAVPLNAIIIGQNPYPNNIFPEVAAAMSYDSELAQRCQNISGNVPPTVRVLANDLFVNAEVPREDTISVIKDGWTLVEKGILLINNAVFHDWRTAEGYKECVNQTTVVLKLLQETEKHGARTVQLFVLGDAAQRMASNICSWHKSSVVRISRKSVTHPAALSRRFDNLYASDCHLGESKFSCALAKLLRNHVAFVHTMSKQSKESPALIRQADSLKHLANNLPRHKETTDEVAAALRDFAMADSSDVETMKAMTFKLAGAMDTLSSRTALLSSLISNAYSSTQTAAGVVSRAAPHEATMLPHTIPEIPPSRASSSPVSFRKSSAARSDAGDSMRTGVSISSGAGASTTPAGSPRLSATPVRPVQFRRRIASSTTEPLDSSPLAPPAISAPGPVSVPFRSKQRTAKPDAISGAQPENVDAPPLFKASKNSGSAGGPLKMTTAQVRQLSCVASTVEILARPVLDTEKGAECLEVIQHDIKNKTKYNIATQELCDAIDADLERDPKFDLSSYALEATASSHTSATMEKCKELFGF